MNKENITKKSKINSFIYKNYKYFNDNFYVNDFSKNDFLFIMLFSGLKIIDIPKLLLYWIFYNMNNYAIINKILSIVYLNSLIKFIFLHSINILIFIAFLACLNILI